MKHIQEWLGHANFATTADVYSHLDYSSKMESASVIAEALSYRQTEGEGEGEEPFETESDSLSDEYYDYDGQEAEPKEEDSEM